MAGHFGPVEGSVWSVQGETGHGPQRGLSSRSALWNRRHSLNLTTNTQHAEAAIKETEQGLRGWSGKISDKEDGREVRKRIRIISLRVWKGDCQENDYILELTDLSRVVKNKLFPERKIFR